MTLRDCQCERADCPQCGPLVRLATEIRRDFEDTKREAHVPTAEIVWWRAQMRARQEAARKAARPIVLTQALAIAALIGLLVSLAGRLTLPAFSFAALSMASPVSVASAASSGLPLLQVAIGALCCLIIAPVAVYFALARD